MPRVTPVLAATTVIAGIMSVYFWQQLRVERERTGILQQRVSQLELAQARPVQAAAPPLAMQLVGKPTEEPATVAAGAGPEASVRGRAAAVREGIRGLLQDPEFRDGMTAGLRTALAQAYPDLAKELNLTPEQANRLLDLISKYRLSSLGNVLGGGAADAAGRQNLQAAVQENERKRDAEISAMLGDAKYQQWKEYEGSLDARQQVTRLRQTVDTSGQPLSQQQERQLITALAAEQRRQTEQAQVLAQPAGASAARDPLAMMEENARRAEENNRRNVEVASSYLNPQQLEAYRNQQSSGQRMTSALLRAQRARAGATLPPAVTAPTN
jgi:hypothetical protein